MTLLYLWSEIVRTDPRMNRDVPTLSHFLFWYVLLINGTMKEIQLNHGKVTHVDDEDYDYLNQFKWYARKHRHDYYAARGQWNGIQTKVVLMHRIIMNTEVGMEVDHINHFTLDNQKSNLRNCTRQENLRNKLPKGISKYNGVSPIKRYYYVYKAAIQVDHKQVFLGAFKTEIEAARAYDNAAKIYYKEFANLNFK
jgi:hypothetical protein